MTVDERPSEVFEHSIEVDEEGVQVDLNIRQVIRLEGLFRARSEESKNVRLRARHDLQAACCPVLEMFGHRGGLADCLNYALIPKLVET